MRQKMKESATEKPLVSMYVLLVGYFFINSLPARNVGRALISAKARTLLIRARARQASPLGKSGGVAPSRIVGQEQRTNDLKSTETSVWKYRRQDFKNMVHDAIGNARKKRLM